jgi:predicted nucleic acid-binding protein
MNRVVLDTNILLRLAEPGHRLHAETAQAVSELRLALWRPVLVPQIAYEFWAVATRSIAANGLGISPPLVHSLLTELTAEIPVLRDERGVYEQWRHLLAEYPVTGVNSHDLRIVAAMKRHRIQSLLTSNPTDFARYSGIEVVTPATVSRIIPAG